jgi:hypothetical protein
VSTSLSEQDFIQLNAYLDGELSTGEREVFEARLAGDVSLRQELDALRVTVSLVRMAERVPLPRNFTLDPAVYGRPARRSGLSGFWPALSTAGAALSTLLVVAGLLFLRGGGAAMAPAEVSEALREEAAEFEAPTAQTFEEPEAEMAEEPAAAEPTEEEAPMAMEAAPAEEPSAEAQMTMQAAPEPGYDEEGAPPPGGLGGGLPSEEPAAEEAAESAPDMVEGEAAPGPTPTLTPFAAPTTAPTVGVGEAGDRAAGEENGAAVAEAPPQPGLAQEQAAAAGVEPPARPKYGAAPLPVILLVVGGLGLAASLFGLFISLRRRG